MLVRQLKYARPASVAEAVELLAADPAARPLAGGQSLVNVLKLRVAEVGALVDVSRLQELRTVRPTAAGGLELGAGLRYADLARDPLVAERAPVVAEVADGTVDVQVRNRGTLGGNLCFNDPTSNFPPLLVALDATIVVARPGGRPDREVAAADFLLGPYRCDLAQGELVRAVVLKPLGAREGVGYATLQLARDSWALARGCAWVARDAQGAIERARIVVACIAPRPARQRAAERALIGTRGEREALERALGGELEGVTPVGDSHASAEYRVEMAREYAKRALRQALATTATEVAA